MTPNPGGRFGRYNLEERLGHGGLAEVWRAVDLSNGRVVALKMFTAREMGGVGDRLRAEVELLATHALHMHPNVVQVYGGGSDPVPYVVMEFMDGGDLAGLVARGPLSIPRTLDVGIAVSNALDAALQAGITHGDLKPSNILLNGAGAIKLGDFNVARVAGFRGASGSGSVLMSFAYAAPEVWDGTVSASSDLYGLGCVLYECLTGRPPFTGGHAEVFRAHMERPPDLSALPAETPPALRSLIGELLAKDPVQRPVDAHAVLVRLTAIRDELERPAPGVPQQIGEWMLESPHATTPWAWIAHHRMTGKQATVELFFGDQSVGDRLRRAVSVNETLVPYGAETLLETNRLLLRPGETLGDQPPPGWVFWVARDEQALPSTPRELTATAMANAADRLRRLVAAAATVRVDLDLSPDNLVVRPDGMIHVRRPGLVPASVAPEAAALAALRATAPPELAAAITSAASLDDAAMAARLARTRTVRMPWRGQSAGPAQTLVPAVPAATGVASAVALRERRAETNGKSRDAGPLAAALLFLLAALVLAGIAFLLLGRPGGPPAATVPGVAVAPTLTPTPAPTTAATPVPIPTDAVVLPSIEPTIPPLTLSPPTPAPLTPAPLTAPPPTDEPPPPTDAPPPPTDRPPRPTDARPPPTDAPPPPQTDWSVGLTSSDRNAQNGQIVRFRATADRNVAGTPYSIQIFNPDTGFVHVQCDTGTTCSIGGARENATARYQARVSRADGSDVQALSRIVTVTWQGSAATVPEPQPTPMPTPQPPPPNPEPDWSVDLSSSQQTAANGEIVRFRATTNRSVTGSGYVIEIFNPDTGFVHTRCGTGSFCSIGGARENTTARYQARVSLPGGGDVQATSRVVTVTWQ